jgi:hypothetical protein
MSTSTVFTYLALNGGRPREIPPQFSHRLSSPSPPLPPPPWDILKSEDWNSQIYQEYVSGGCMGMVVFKTHLKDWNSQIYHEYLVLHGNGCVQNTSIGWNIEAFDVCTEGVGSKNQIEDCYVTCRLSSSSSTGGWFE